MKAAEFVLEPPERDHIDKNEEGPEQVDPVNLHTFWIVDQPADTHKQVGDTQTDNDGQKGGYVFKGGHSSTDLSVPASYLIPCLLSSAMITHLTCSFTD